MNYDESKREFDLLDYWRVIVKRKWVLFFFATAVIFLVGLYSFTAIPKYEARVTLLIEEETSKLLSIEDEFGLRRQVSDLRFFNTQLVLLQSESLAERIAKKLDLPARPEFTKGKKSLLGKITKILTFGWLRSRKDLAGEAYLSNPYADIAEKLLKSVEVTPILETKVVELTYASPYPLLSAEIANKLAEEFIVFSIEKRSESTQQASDFLTLQIANIQDDLAASERELQRYSEEKDIVMLSDTESAVINKYDALYQEYTQTQIQSANANAKYRGLIDLDVNSLPQTIQIPLIQNLKEEYLQLKNEYEGNLKFYKPDYPDMKRQKAGLDGKRAQLGEEIQKAVEAAKNEYDAAIKREYSIKSMLDRQRSDVTKMSSDAIHYNNLRIEVENKRKLLDSLVEMQQTTDVSARLAGLKTSYINIIDRAKVPKNPASPKKMLNLLLAIMIGLFGGVGLCFLFEYMDNTVKSPEDVEKMVGLPSLGVIPFLSPDGMSKKKYYGRHGKKDYVASSSLGSDRSESLMPEVKEIEFVNLKHPKFHISEDYRTIRTSILLSKAGNPPRTIVFTSSLPSEGKTATVVNMAVAFGQLGKKVLVIDADLRKPRLHRLFKVRSTNGLSGYLTGKLSIENAIHRTEIDNIWFMPSGVLPPNPAELLDSSRMNLLMEGVKRGFDITLLDSPPVLAVIDAVVVGSQADGVILIVQHEKTARKPFLKAVEELKQSNVKMIGVMFNQAKVSKKNSYYMDYYVQSRDTQ